MPFRTVLWVEKRILNIPMVLVNDLDRTLHTNIVIICQMATLIHVEYSWHIKFRFWYAWDNNSFQTTSTNFSLTKLHDFDELHSIELFLLEFQLSRENLFKFTVLLFHRVLVKLLLILYHWALFINWHLVGELFCWRFHIYYLRFVPR